MSIRRSIKNIINYLIVNIDSKIKGYSIYNGKPGYTILYFILFRYTKNKCFLNKANYLLNEICNNIAKVDKLEYGKGITGVGWMIEWINQNDYINVNTDIILEDIDNVLYKSILYSPSTNVSLNNGSLGQAVYFLNRYKSSNPNTHRYRRICHQECLVILTDDIREKILGEKGLLNDKTNLNEAKSISNILIFFSKFIKYSINKHVVEECIYELINFSEDILYKSIIKHRYKISERSLYNLLYLAYGYWISGYSLNCKIWEKKGVYYINSLLEKIDSYTKNYINLINTLPMLVKLYQYKKGLRYRKTIEYIINNANINDRNHGFINGLGNILLSGIDLLSNEKSYWEQILTGC